MTIEFQVVGIPKPGGSKRGFIYKGKDGKQHIAMTDASGAPGKSWRESVKAAAMKSLEGKNKLVFQQAFYQSAIRLLVQFYFQRPKSHYGSGKNANVIKASAPQCHTVKPDATKLLRSLEDALTGILWRDDAQIVIQVVSKNYCVDGDLPGAHVKVETL